MLVANSDVVLTGNADDKLRARGGGSTMVDLRFTLRLVSSAEKTQRVESLLTDLVQQISEPASGPDLNVLKGYDVNRKILQEPDRTQKLLALEQQRHILLGGTALAAPPAAADAAPLAVPAPSLPPSPKPEMQSPQPAEGRTGASKGSIMEPLTGLAHILLLQLPDSVNDGFCAHEACAMLLCGAQTPYGKPFHLSA